MMKRLPILVPLALAVRTLVFATEHLPKEPSNERLENGEARVTFDASKEHFYQIEASTDLKSWTPLSTSMVTC